MRVSGGSAGTVRVAALDVSGIRDEMDLIGREIDRQSRCFLSMVRLSEQSVPPNRILQPD